MSEKCILMDENGHCTKWRKNGKCIKSDVTWCDDALELIEPDQMCRKSSIFGNYYFYITEEQLEALKNGKVLCDVDEYGIFIALQKESKHEEA